MSSAQVRAARQAIERADRASAARDEVLDVLLAILEVNGGEVRIPQGAVHTAVRQEVVLTFTNDDVIVQTKARHAMETFAQIEPRGILRRIGGLFSGQ